jgi:hypothetical protein
MKRSTKKLKTPTKPTPEDECVTRQNAGLPPCGKCQTCADELFFSTICDEVEETPRTKH